MNIKGWEYNFKSLKFWNDESLEYDEIWLEEKNDLCVLLYNTCEIHMACYTGYIAIFKCKDNPVLVYNSKFRCDDFWCKSSLEKFFSEFIVLDIIVTENSDADTVLILDTKRKRATFSRRSKVKKIYRKKGDFNPRFQIWFKWNIVPFYWLYWVYCVFAFNFNFR